MRLTLEDRYDIRELFSLYGWALDTGNVEGVVTCFTDPGSVQIRDTNYEADFDDIRSWITGMVKRPGFRGRQHHMSQFVIKATEDGARVHAFWLVAKTETITSSNRFIHGHGYYVADLVNDESWRIHGLRIGFWNDQDLPWQGELTEPGIAERKVMQERRSAEKAPQSPWR